jgi:hypothetical protein
VAVAAALGWGIGSVARILIDERDPDMQRYRLADAAIKSRERAADQLGRPLTHDELLIFNQNYKKARQQLERHIQLGI